PGYQSRWKSDQKRANHVANYDVTSGFLHEGFSNDTENFGSGYGASVDSISPTPVHVAEVVNPQSPFIASSSGHSSGFTQEQYQKILELIQQTPSPHLPQQVNANAMITTNLSSTNFSGFHSCFHSLSNHNLVSWIVDTGATDHICCSLSLFSS